MMFTAKELRIMDAPTADNKVVLASMGGKPKAPNDMNEKNAGTESSGMSGSADDQEEIWSVTDRDVPREGLRERSGGWSEA